MLPWATRRAGVEDGDVRGQLPRLLEVVGAQQHGAVALEPAQHVLHVAALDRIEAAGGLVDDHQRRVVEKGLGQRDALLEALREVADQPLGHVLRA